MLLLSVLAFGCNKGSVNNGNNNGGSGNNGGGGGSIAGLTVTGYLPVRPYLLDTLVINGTGFDPDKSHDTVLFNFSLGKILSATSTQLKLTMPEESNISLPGATYNCKLEVRSYGKRLQIPGGITFKRVLQLNGIQDPDYFNAAWGRPDDSLAVLGSGFNVNAAAMQISIGTTTLSNYKTDSNYHCTATTRLPKTIFGGSNDEDAEEQRMVTVRNADGKTDSKMLNFYISPRMRVSYVGAEKSSYTKGELATGGVVILNIQGRNLKNDVRIELTGPAGSGFQTNSTLGVSGFPNSASVSLGSSFQNAGNYHVNLYRGQFLYGATDFRIEN
jgi:hypothetical protein